MVSYPKRGLETPRRIINVGLTNQLYTTASRIATLVDFFLQADVLAEFFASLPTLDIMDLVHGSRGPRVSQESHRVCKDHVQFSLQVHSEGVLEDAVNPHSGVVIDRLQ